MKPCSGLIVTSYAKSDVKNNIEIFFPAFGDYNYYKNINKHAIKYPSVYHGNIVEKTF